MSFLDHDDKTEFAMHFGTARQHHAILDAGPSFNTLKVMVKHNPHKEIVDRLIDRPTDTGVDHHKIHAAIAQSTPHADHLDKLMHHEHHEVRAAVADNEHAQKHHLDHLMHDASDTIVHRVARRNDLQQHHREHISNHPDEVVVGEVAKHPSMHNKLINHPDEHVRHRVAQYAVKKEHLDTLASDPSAHVRASVAANRHAGHLHSILMHDPTEKVRLRVAANTPHKEIAQHLTNDKDRQVADMARERVKFHTGGIKIVGEGLVGFRQFSEKN